MEGIIVVNKPKGITSFDVIRKLKKILKTKKIGHTGTFDPLATGVMLMCVGKATKFRRPNIIIRLIEQLFIEP